VGRAGEEAKKVRRVGRAIARCQRRGIDREGKKGSKGEWRISLKVRTSRPKSLHPTPIRKAGKGLKKKKKEVPEELRTTSGKKSFN